MSSPGCARPSAVSPRARQWTAALPSSSGLAEVLPVATRRGAALALVLRADPLRAVRPLRRLRQLDEGELADLHAGVDRDREIRDVRELERHVPVPPGVDEARGRMDQQPEPPQA